MKHELVKPRFGGPFSLYCYACNVWVPNTANYEMRKEGCYSHSHFCFDGKRIPTCCDGAVPGDQREAVLHLIKTGYSKRLVKIVDSPNNDGAVCKIGEHWFYFGGEEAANATAKEYIKIVPADDIINEIVDVLCDFSKDEGFLDEYDYYVAFLAENIDSPLDIDRNIVSKLRTIYPVGCRVKLLKMDDPQAPPIGTFGTVTGVDDIGSILVNWDNGCGLNVVYGEDVCVKI